jgi:hypothetical protein
MTKQKRWPIFKPIFRNNWGVSYTIGGVSDLCKRLKINGYARAAENRPPHTRQQLGAIGKLKKFKRMRLGYPNDAIFFMMTRERAHMEEPRTLQRQCLLRMAQQHINFDYLKQ